MSEAQMRALLEAIRRAAETGNARLARDLASAGLTVLNGSQIEAEHAWSEIEIQRASNGSLATARNR